MGLSKDASSAKLTLKAAAAKVVDDHNVTGEFETLFAECMKEVPEQHTSGG